MRINLRCPFDQKDEAKALGAKWDIVKKTWYIVDIEDLTPFMKWIREEPAPSSPPSPGSITLDQYLETAYGTHKSLTARAAHAFGVPYPLQNGWIQKYSHKTISSATALLLAAKAGSKREKREAGHAPAATSSSAAHDCGCDHILPWEDCEHTEAAAAAALEEILA